MPTNTFSCPNQKNANHVRILPLDTCYVSDMLKINLFTKLDDCKVNKSKLIYDKCGKDLKCKIDDKTMNELKKCFKFEIDDKTKNELKENIKSELEKGLKFEIGDKTKNELKENIKSELEKGLKFEIGDKTKNELKENIKSELEKGLKFEIGDETKNELKDKIKKEIIDEIDWCNVIDLCNDEGSKGTLEGMLITEEQAKVNCSAYGDINKPAWFTKDLLKQFFPDLMIKKNIMDHFDTKGGKQQYHAKNFAITFKCEEDPKCGSNVNFTWNSPSNMWCDKGSGNSLCPKDFFNKETSVCCPATAPLLSKNFFLNNKCPNLILDLKGEELEKCAGKTIVAKLESPLIILDPHERIIDKNGNNTEIYYYQLKPHLNPDGTMKDCGDNADCQKYAKIIDKILWTSDKEVKLTITGTGNKETGNKETGNKETGNKETGNKETGNKETGNKETGNKETGNKETGNKETGNEEKGNKEKGNEEKGNKEKGNEETGNNYFSDSEGMAFSHHGYGNDLI